MIWQIDNHLTIMAMTNELWELGRLEVLACFYHYMSHDLSVNGIVSATRNHFDVKGEVNHNLQERFMNRLNSFV